VRRSKCRSSGRAHTVDFACRQSAFTALLDIDLTPVAVELTDDAAPLPAFEHPDRAFYVFGPEDGTLSGKLLGACADRVAIPAARCLNLAAAVSVVLYDRCAKHGQAG
jgi:tRNA(Leu) C34 or U34 (ribose-2'-O)-methylase TrmL